MLDIQRIQVLDLPRPGFWVKEFCIARGYHERDIRLLLQALLGYDLIIMGTLQNLHQSRQAALVNGILKVRIPNVVTASTFLRS